MSRALRYAPPLANRGLVMRPRLLAHLQTRFERPLTAVVAAAGFGKTTLLAQAVRENALSPMGEDHWLTCQRDDTSLSFLAGATFASVGLAAPVPEDPRSAAIAVAESIWSAAPRHVALILDDAHLVGPASEGGRFLSELVEELPRNGHLVVASRPPLQLHTSRLRANGDALLLDEQDMQFQDDEVAEFAEARHVPPELLSDVGRWPALAELTATAGPAAVTGYVWEELLSRLTPARRHALAVLVAVAGADQEIAAALLGPDVRLEELLDGLPLVVRAPSGWWSLHPLWASALPHHLDAGQVAEARRTAGLVLARRRRYHDAMDLLLEAEAWDDVRGLVVEVCEVGTPLVAPGVLEVWLRRLPREVREGPEGLLLSATVVEPRSPATAETLLQRAFAAAPDSAAVRHACLNGLVEVAFRQFDRPRMQGFIDRLTQAAEPGHSQALRWSALFHALIARTPEEVRAMLAAPSLLSGSPLSPVQEWLHTHVVLHKLGDPEAAEPLARRALAHAPPNMQPVSRYELMESFRLRGRLDEAKALLPDLLHDIHPAKVLTSPELVTYAVVLLSILGRHDQARGLLETYRPTIAASPVAWAPAAGALAAAFQHVSVGDEQQAVDDLRSVLHLQRVRNRGAVLQTSPAALPLLYVLVPEIRAHWDADPPPGCFAEVQRLARALVDMRERGSLVAVGQLPRGARRVMCAVLPVPWTTELAVGMVVAGQDEGRARLEELGTRARATLRAQSSAAPGPVAATARRLLREIPAPPAHRLRLRILGPLELRRDGAVVVPPELRRERVRQLLGYLLCHERPTRTAVMADLWPDLDEAAAGRNLRVTLAYLQNVLEPDREELDPPYYVRTPGSVLHLVIDGALEVDAMQFERSLDEAARLERQGAPSAALIAYERAVDLWAGDYLVDVTGGDWLEWERDRLRGRFVAAAVRAGDLFLARNDAPKARTLAERALRADAWSENAYQLLVAAQLATGDLVNAHRTLQRCHQMLRELGVGQQPRTLALGRRLAAHR
jgi:LuxR family transcriptional regulator, maltose regulon positive regulatory protein